MKDNFTDWNKDSKKTKEFLKKHFFTFDLYEKTAKDNLRIHKTHKSFHKLTDKEQHYYEFIYETFFKIDTNIVELSKGLKTLLNKKNLMPSVFILRGLTELIFFNIFVVFKSYISIRKKKY